MPGPAVVVGAPGYKNGMGRAYVFAPGPAGAGTSRLSFGELTPGLMTPSGSRSRSQAPRSWSVRPGRTMVRAVLTFSPGSAQAGPQRPSFEGSETPPNAGFGLSVGISGGTAVVGAPNARQVYIFTDNRTGWHQTAELKGSGTATEISGLRPLSPGGPSWWALPATFCLLAPSTCSNRTATGWHKQAELEGSDHSPRFRPSRQTFGSSVAIWGDNVIIGAPSDSVAHSGAFVFTKGSPGWRQVAALEDLAGYGTELAEPVAVSGNTVLVGGLSSAYVFNRTETGWGRIAELRPSHVLANGDFGFAVALSGRTVIVGTGNDPSGDRAYVFES